MAGTAFIPERGAPFNASDRRSESSRGSDRRSAVTGAFGGGLREKALHDSCIECGLIHRLSTACPQVDECSDVDIMDPPDLFWGLYDDGETTGMPADRLSVNRPPSPGGPSGPRAKDASVQIPNTFVMRPAIQLASRRGDVITSGREGYSGDGVHAISSQHYTGTAVDVRYDPRGRAQQIDSYRRLGYVVIEEPTHLHVQAYPVRA